MEQPTKRTYQDLAGKELCALLAQTEFSNRYYAMCKLHPLRIHKKFSFSKNEVFQILAEIGQTPEWDSRDRSYSFNLTLNGWSIHRGFVLQHQAVEFGFSAHREQKRAGTNYTGIARATIELIDPAKIPNPPFPRPNCYSHDELREVLRECFQLSDLLCSALDKIPTQNCSV